jgi:hypothetical protein
MSLTNIAWPQKTHDIHNHHFDSTVWDDFVFRNDNIVVATYAKTGTAWTRQIVAQLQYGDAQGIDILPCVRSSIFGFPRRRRHFQCSKRRPTSAP